MKIYNNIDEINDINESFYIVNDNFNRKHKITKEDLDELRYKSQLVLNEFLKNDENEKTVEVSNFIFKSNKLYNKLQEEQNEKLNLKRKRNEEFLNEVKRKK